VNTYSIIASTCTSKVHKSSREEFLESAIDDGESCVPEGLSADSCRSYLVDNRSASLGLLSALR